MRARLYDDGAELLAAAEPFFRSDPFSANVIAVVTTRVVADNTTDSADYLWATLENADGEVLGAAMHTPPFPLFLSRMPPEAATALAGVLVDAGRELPGVSGAGGSTGPFAEAWCARTGLTYGAAVTAAATASALAAGVEHVVLYADLANPTSNSIYQAIGFRPDHDAEQRTFH